MKTLWRITNLVQSEVVVEDIGLRLARGASKVIDDNTYLSSRNLVALSDARVVSVAAAQPARPSVWPLSSPRLPPPPPPPPRTDDRDSAVASLVQSMAAMQERIGQLVDALSKQQPSQAVAYPMNPAAAPIPMVPFAQTAEVTFIPSKVVPDADTSNLKVKSDEVSADGFDDARSALKKARKR